MEELIISASKEAILSANINEKDIDLIILSSSTPENLFGDASKIAYKIGAINAFAFDIRNACNGFIIGIVTAENFLKNDNYNYALVIGADCLSKYINWTDRKSCILFGDGCGTAILGKSNKIDGIIGNMLKTNGELHNILNINYQNNYEKINNIELVSSSYNKLTIDGLAVYKFVIDNIPIYINNFLKEKNIKIDNIKYFILHQANIRIIDEISNKLNINKNKFLYNIDTTGNTSAASIPILLNDVYKKNILNKGDLILLCGFGAGMSSGMILLNWTMDNIKLNKKVALITGGSKGIGKSIAIKLKKKGYKTIVCSRTNGNIQKDIDYYKADVSKYNDLQKLYEYIYNKYGRLDILVNNAGIEGSEKLLIDTDIDNIENIININLMGTIYSTKIMLPLLKKNNGIIINISSIASGNSIINCHRRTLYSLTKSAINTFTRGMAGELINNCNIYSLNPSFVNTNLLDRIADKHKINKYLMNHSGIINEYNEIIEPDEIANIISILLDGKTRYKSGDEILLLGNNKTSYMKYIYKTMNYRDNFKINIKDIEEYNINNLCFFQGQGLKINIQIEIIEEYIKKYNYDELFIKIINMNFNNLLKNYKNDENNTLYQQLIIFISSYILYNIEKVNNSKFFNNVKYMAGYSIGEISALVCANKILFEDGLKIVFTRGYYMHLISKSIDTTMITVKGIDLELIKQELSNNIFISINFNQSFNIIGGDKEELNNFKNNILSKYENVLFNTLLVEGAYHTIYYKDVANKLDDILNNINYNNNDIIIWSNYNSIIYDIKNYKELIQNQVFNTVNWYTILKEIEKLDINCIKEISCSTNFLIKEYNNLN